MLCQFSFKNFKSYKDETTYDFQADAISEFSDSIIRTDGCSDILPVSVVYGPNGGGKSNLLQALACLISTVVVPIHELGKNRVPIILQQKVPCVPFTFDDSSCNEPTEFRIYFRTAEAEYRYYLALLNDLVTNESLDRKSIGAKKTAHIFDREGGTVELGYSLSGKGINTSVNEKMPFFSFLAINYSLPTITEAQEWFESCIIRSYANPMAERSIMLSENETFKKQLILALNGMDIDVSGYRYDESMHQLFMQRVIDGKTVELAFQDESDGTKKLIAALPAILIALSEGRLVIIDELDAKLHPKLLKYTILMFKNPELNTNGAQLLFTSHDMATMKNTVFRRDEIWFAAENAEHVSEIYSLYDIRKEDNERVNSTAAFDKQYMEGRYGADPYLQNMIGGNWE